MTVSIYSATGITGNFYLWSDGKDILQAFCKGMGKSISSIYYNRKYKVYAVRIKSKKHKVRAKNLFESYPSRFLLKGRFPLL